MQRFAVTLWHGALLLVLVMGVLVALIGATERFVPTWYAPGLLPLVAIVAVEAMITQWMIVRERQPFEEQAKSRILELVIIVLVVRLWSLAAQGEPLLTTLSPWLREPLRFFTGRFFEYFVWTLIAWVMSALLMNDVLDWQSGAMIPGLTDDSIERDQLQQEWDQSVARYRSRYILLTFLMLAAATLAAYDRTSMRAIHPAALVATSISALVAGLLLQSAGRLSVLRRSWTLDNIDVDAGVTRRWGRLGVLLVLALVLLAPILGSIMLVAPPPPLVPILNVILVGMTIVVSIVLLLISIILSPLVWLISLLRGSDEAPPPPSMPEIVPPQIRQPHGDYPLLPALIFWGCIALLIGIALARYLSGRAEIGEIIRRWRILRWLRMVAGELLSDARGWAALAVASLGRLRRRTRQRQRRRAEGVQGQLRVLYRRMRSAGTRRGVVSRASQTPYEYSAELARSLSVVSEDVRGLTDAYVAVEYGPTPDEPSYLRQARRHWRRLQRWLFRSSALRRRQRPPTEP